MDQEIGIWIVFILTFLFLAFYFWGRSKNYKIQKKAWTDLRPHIRQYGRKVGFKGLGSSAFQISVPGRDRDSFERAELAVALLPRDLLIQYLISKIQGKKDEIIVKAQFKSKPNFSLEILSAKFKSPKKGETKLNEMQVSNILSHVKVFTSDETLASSLIRSIKKELKKLEENLQFFSLSKEQPNLIFSCSMTPEVYTYMFPLIEKIGLNISKIQ